MQILLGIVSVIALFMVYGIYLGAVGVFFLPTIIGIKKQTGERFRKIVLLNLLLGWTIVGWIKALNLAKQKE